MFTKCKDGRMTAASIKDGYVANLGPVEIWYYKPDKTYVVNKVGGRSEWLTNRKDVAYSTARQLVDGVLV